MCRLIYSINYKQNLMCGKIKFKKIFWLIHTRIWLTLDGRNNKQKLCRYRIFDAHAQAHCTHPHKFSHILSLPEDLSKYSTLSPAKYLKYIFMYVHCCCCTVFCIIYMCKNANNMRGHRSTQLTSTYLILTHHIASHRISTFLLLPLTVYIFNQCHSP